MAKAKKKIPWRVQAQLHRVWRDRRLGRAAGSAPYDPPAWPSFAGTRLADLSRIATINNGASITQLSNVTTEGADAVRVTNIPTSDIVLAPLAANLVPAIDMSGGGTILIRWRPITNVSSATNRLSGGRFVLEIFSGSSVTTGNYHESSRFGTGSTGNIQPTSPDASTAGRVQGLAVPVAEFTAFGTGATLSAITGARIRLRGSTADAVIEVIDITYYPPTRTKAACVIYFDDADESQITYIAPKLAEYGWAAVSMPGAIEAQLGTAGKLTLAQLKQLQTQYGWQIGSQSLTSEDTADFPDYATLKAEFDALKVYYAENGLNGGESGSYFANVGFQEVARTPAFRDSWRDTRLFLLGNATTPPFTHGETWPPYDKHMLRCYSGATAAWGASAGTYLTSAIDRAIANGGSGIFRVGWHNELASAGDARTAFETMLAYLDANRASIDVLTHDALIRATVV